MSGILSDAGCDSKEVLQGGEHKCGGQYFLSAVLYGQTLMEFLN